MKKFFILAIALVASALVLTSCETKIDHPLVGNWNAKGLFYNEEEFEFYDTYRTFRFLDNGDFQYTEYLYDLEDRLTNDGAFLEGSWSVDGDILTLHKKKFGTIEGGKFIYDDSYKLPDETNKWFIEGLTLHLIRLYGTEDEFEEEFYYGLDK